MTQPLGLRALVAAPAAGFEQPFEMLEACHERVRRMLALLARLRAHLRDQGADGQAQQAAQDVMRYFDQAAPQHHQDEELHVFPALLRQGDATVLAVVRHLQQDHVEMASRWQIARRVLERIAAGELDRLASEDEAALHAFATLHAEHLRTEEEIAYPAAQPLLDERSLSAMSQDMMRRRGVKP
jgi:hemerythrin-like domain-containing protein